MAAPRSIDHAVTVALAAGYLSVEFGVTPPDEPRWRGGILFDRAVRRALVGDTRGTRDAWNTASDVLALIPQGMMLVDSLFVPLLSDDWNTEVAWHLSVIAVQSEALTGLLARAGHHGIARERPDVGPCRQDPGRPSLADVPLGRATRPDPTSSRSARAGGHATNRNAPRCCWAPLTLEVS